MRFLSRMPYTMIGSLMGIAWLTNSGSLLLRRKAICDLIPEGVAVGMGWFDFAMTCNLERADGFVIF
jgi:hypothetical protein